jgi:hypothetical protein
MTGEDDKAAFSIPCNTRNMVLKMTKSKYKEKIILPPKKKNIDGPPVEDRSL